MQRMEDGFESVSVEVSTSCPSLKFIVIASTSVNLISERKKKEINLCIWDNWALCIKLTLFQVVFICFDRMTNKQTKNGLTPSLPRLSNIYVQLFATHKHTHAHNHIYTHAIFHSIGYLKLKQLKYSYTRSSHTYKQIHAHTHTHTHTHTYMHTHQHTYTYCLYKISHN